MSNTSSGLLYGALLLIYAQFQPAGFAFQSAPQKIFIEPRKMPPVAGTTGDTSAHLRVDASLVLISANVSTDTGARVTDLQKDNFRIFEDGDERQITYFAMEDAPVSVGLLFDSSGSMHNKMKQSTQAAAELFKTASPEDEFFLVEFNERPKLTVPFTTDLNELYDRVSHIRTVGRTSLLDAIQMSLNLMKKGKNTRKALIILSDGGDNRSRATAAQVKAAVLESDVLLYAMGIFDVGKGTREEQNGPKLLDALTAQSGGKHFRADSADDLPSISARIGNELRSQYVLGYAPGALENDGRYHRVKVDLELPPDMPPLRVHYRPGYFAPAR